MRRLSILLVAGAFACSGAPSIDHGGTPNGPTTNPSGNGGSGGSGGTGTGGNGSGGSGGTTGGGGPAGGPICSNTPANEDQDGDGYTPAQGDCNDCDPNINPGAIDVAGDGKDNDCNGSVDDPQPACDTGATGKADPQSLTQSIELCDSRFVKMSAMAGASDMRARKVMPAFGTVVKPQAGVNMALLSTGLAEDKTTKPFTEPQDGTDLKNSGTNPLPNLAGSSNCGQGAQSDVHDYTEYVLTLKAPTNVQSFSFQFQFFSAEYPEFVCTAYNDEFLVIIQSSKTYPTATNISFDANKNPITVNSGFFTICQNGSSPQTMNCKQGVDQIAGTGYEDDDGSGIFGSPEPIGGSTGWLTTTAPIAAGEDITLRFVIFDENDGIYDSAALIDNFTWGTTTVSGPVTGPITKRIIRHSAGASLMCKA
jgi:hypothetical protein